MDNETLIAIRQLFAEEREYTSRMLDEKLDEKLAPINDRLDVMQKGITTMRADIRQIKRDASITRITVNSLGEWVDEAREVTGVSYPAK